MAAHQAAGLAKGLTLNILDTQEFQRDISAASLFDTDLSNLEQRVQDTLNTAEHMTTLESPTLMDSPPYGAENAAMMSPAHSLGMQAITEYSYLIE